MAVVLGWPGRMTDPAFGIDERLVVHADLKVVLHRPLAPEGQLMSRPRIREVIDKGPGNAAIIQIDARSRRHRRHADRHGRKQRDGAQARRLRRQGHRCAGAAGGARHGAEQGVRSADAAQPRAPLSPQRRRESAACRSAARQGGGLRAPDPAWRRELRHRGTRDRAADRLPRRSGLPASRRASRGRCSRARPSAPRCGRTARACRSNAAWSSAATSC